MRILFFMHSVNYDRLFEDALDALLARGHEVHVAFDRDMVKREGDDVTFGSLRARRGGFSYGPSPERSSDSWPLVSRGLRADRDYLRYFEPAFASAEPLRARAEQRAHGIVRVLAAVGSARGRRALARALRALDRAVPLDPAVLAFIRDRTPDVVVVTPLVNFGSPQDDYVRAARRLDIPSVLAVASWDNLTNKGLVRESPDLTLVWNEVQRREAVELHGLPAEQVVVTGAHSYDHWFDWRPSTTAEEFTRQVGLRPGRPFLLYVGSSSFIAPNEPETARRWLERLRAADAPLLREVDVVVRPHPANTAGWTDSSLDALGARVWPRAGERPRGGAKAAYFDSLYHSSAVFGLNTSALIEAAIIGRPVLTLVEGETATRQVGTLHFGYIADGVLRVARSWPEHEQQLVAALENGADGREEAFVRSFVRPHGLDAAASGFLVDAVERAARLRPVTERRSAAERALRPAVATLSLTARTRRARKRARKRLRPAEYRLRAAAASLRRS